jgi:hypothetical protein
MVFGALGAGARASTDEDWRVRRLNERYDDFFAHAKREREFDKEREAGAGEVKKADTQWDREMAAAAREFIKNRPPPPNLDAAYHEWESEQKKYAQQHEADREQYVRVKDRIERLEKTSKKIPANLEYGLDNLYGTDN